MIGEEGRALLRDIVFNHTRRRVEEESITTAVIAMVIITLAIGILPGGRVLEEALFRSIGEGDIRQRSSIIASGIIAAFPDIILTSFILNITSDTPAARDMRTFIRVGGPVRGCITVASPGTNIIPWRVMEIT